MKWTRSVWGPSLGVCGMARGLDSSSTGGRGKAALVGFGRTATRARRGLGATFPVAALFQKGARHSFLVAFLGSLHYQASISVTVLQRIASSGLSKPFH